MTEQQKALFYAQLSRNIEFSNDSTDRSLPFASYGDIRRVVEHRRPECLEELDHVYNQIKDDENFVKSGKLTRHGIHELFAKSGLGPEWSAFLLDSLETMCHNYRVLHLYILRDEERSDHFRDVFGRCVNSLTLNFHFTPGEAKVFLMNQYKDNWRAIVPLFQTATSAYRLANGGNNPPGSLIQNCTLHAKNKHASLLDPLADSLMLYTHPVPIEERDAILERCLQYVDMTRTVMQEVNSMMFANDKTILARLNFNKAFSRQLALQADRAQRSYLTN